VSAARRVYLRDGEPEHVMDPDEFLAFVGLACGVRLAKTGLWRGAGRGEADGLGRDTLAWLDVLADLKVLDSELYDEDRWGADVLPCELSYRYVIPFLILSERTSDGFQSGKCALAVLRGKLGTRDGTSARWIADMPQDEWDILLEKIALAVPSFYVSSREDERGSHADADDEWKRLSVAVLREYAQFWEFSTDRNADYKMRAYLRVLDYVASGGHLPTADKDLQQIRGVGKGIAGKLSLAFRTGEVPDVFAESGPDVGRFVGEALGTRGLGPAVVKRALALGVRDMDAFLDAADELRLTPNQIWSVQNREMLARRVSRKALAATASALTRVVPHSVVAGSFRRRLATVGDLDLLVEGRPSHAALLGIYAALSDGGLVADGYDGRPRSGSSTGMTLYLRHGRGNGVVQLDVRVVSRAQWPYALAYFTGSKDYGLALRRRAKSMGLKLSEYSLMYRDSVDPASDPVYVGSEAMLWMVLGLSYSPPEDRSRALERAPSSLDLFLSDGQRCPGRVVLDSLRGSGRPGRDCGGGIWEGVGQCGRTIFAASVGIPLLWTGAPWQYCVGDLGDDESAAFTIKRRDVDYWMELLGVGVDRKGYFSGKRVVPSATKHVSEIVFDGNAVFLR